MQRGRSHSQLEAPYVTRRSPQERQHFIIKTFVHSSTATAEFFGQGLAASIYSQELGWMIVFLWKRQEVHSNKRFPILDCRGIHNKLMPLRLSDWLTCGYDDGAFPNSIPHEERTLFLANLLQLLLVISSERVSQSVNSHYQYFAGLHVSHCCYWSQQIKRSMRLQHRLFVSITQTPPPPPPRVHASNEKDCHTSPCHWLWLWVDDALEKAYSHPWASAE